MFFQFYFTLSLDIHSTSTTANPSTNSCTKAKAAISTSNSSHQAPTMCEIQETRYRCGCKKRVGPIICDEPLCPAPDGGPHLTNFMIILPYSDCPDYWKHKPLPPKPKEKKGEPSGR